MKSITIQGVKRESVGKRSTKALRNADQVPCVVYGGTETLHFSAPEKSFRNLVYTPDAHIVNLELADGTKVEAMLKDIQFHPVTDRIIHADFYQLFEDKPVVMQIPVRLSGRARGVVAGGSLLFSLRKLDIRAIPSKLPDVIEIDISNMRIGSKKYIEDLRAESDDYTILHPDDAVVCQVRTSRLAIEEEDEEEEGEEGEETAAEGEGAAEGEAPAEE